MSVSTTPPTVLPDRDRRLVLSRRVRLFVAATITYNVIEAIVAITAGTIASSTALIAFGLDSVIEVTSALAVAWQFAAKDPDIRERTALRIIAFSFFALAAYVGVDAVWSLVGGGEARHSVPGLVLAALSLLIMPVLSYGQRRAGRELNSRSAVADSKQTLLCTYLSAVLLVGLTVNALFGWWWADPIAALVIAAVAVREGRQAWKGDGCCAPGAELHHRHDRAAADDSCATAEAHRMLNSADVDPCCAPANATAERAGTDTGCDNGCDCCPSTNQAQSRTPATRSRSLN